MTVINTTLLHLVIAHFALASPHYAGVALRFALTHFLSLGGWQG